MLQRDAAASVGKHLFLPKLSLAAWLSPNSRKTMWDPNVHSIWGTVERGILTLRFVVSMGDGVGVSSFREMEAKIK